MRSADFCDPSVDLHSPTHLESASGSHWDRKQLEAFKVSFETAPAKGGGCLPSLQSGIEYYKPLLTTARNRRRQSLADSSALEAYESLRNFIQYGADVSSYVHPMDLLRSAEIGGQFYHDLAVASLRNFQVADEIEDEEDLDGNLDGMDSNDTTVPRLRSRTRAVTSQAEFHIIRPDVVASPTGSKVVMLELTTPESKTSMPMADPSTGTTGRASYKPSSEVSIEIDDLLPSPLVKPETVTQAVAKSFIETVLSLRPDSSVGDSFDDVRLSFLIGQNTFRLDLPAFRCTIINDGGIVYTNARTGKVPSNRVFLSLEAKAKQQQRSAPGFSRAGQTTTALKGDIEILAQQCAELVGQADSDPRLKNGTGDKTYTYYLVSLTGCAISFLSATFTPAYVDYLYSACENSPCKPDQDGTASDTNDRSSSVDAMGSEGSSSNVRAQTARKAFSFDQTVQPLDFHRPATTTAASPADLPSSATPSLASSPVRPYGFKRDRSDLTDEGLRNTRELDTSEGDVAVGGVRLKVVRSREFLLTEVAGRVGAVAHLLALFDVFEEETGRRF